MEETWRSIDCPGWSRRYLRMQLRQQDTFLLSLVEQPAIVGGLVSDLLIGRAYYVVFVSYNMSRLTLLEPLSPPHIREIRGLIHETAQQNQGRGSDSHEVLREMFESNGTLSNSWLVWNTLSIPSTISDLYWRQWNRSVGYLDCQTSANCYSLYEAHHFPPTEYGNDQANIPFSQTRSVATIANTFNEQVVFYSATCQHTRSFYSKTVEINYQRHFTRCTHGFSKVER